MECMKERKCLDMRIDQVTRVNQVYNTNATKKVNSINTTKVQDTLAISQTGRDMQIAKQAIANANDIRMDRVNDVRLKLKNGLYDGNTNEFAEALVSKINESVMR
ncbi:MAG: anti-sigma-28 factor, FlgM [Clostridiales bacterium]|jgi:negative regulator of flagellin synthesis FlgM|nr:anti-sigma-28 factor, FlgM [Clostridiales bacterium]